MHYRAFRNSQIFSLVFAAFTLHLGCATPQAHAAPPDGPEHAQPQPQVDLHAQELDEGQPLCPTDLPDVRVEARDVDRGVAITFSGPRERVEAVQGLTRQMATSYQRCQQMMRESHEGMMHQRAPGRRGPGRPGAPRMGMMHQRRGPMHMMLGADIQVQERPDGAEIIMLAEDPKHVEALRARERWHVEMMRLGHCPMMGMMREMEWRMELERREE